MFDSAETFGVETFTAIVLLTSAALSAHIMYGWGTRKAREAFVGLVLLMMFFYQLYYLVLASQYIPADSTYMFNDKLYRGDCRLSDKGGKRPQGRHRAYDINPCFCHEGAECILTETGVTVSTNNTCPTTGAYSCYNPVNGAYIELYNDHERGCKGGQGTQCTKDQPCDPCSYSKMVDFGIPNGAGRCTACSTDFRGNCDFVPGVGPYCRVTNTSKAIEPCKSCCTEALTVLVDGVCY